MSGYYDSSSEVILYKIFIPWFLYGVKHFSSVQSPEVYLYSALAR